MNKRPEPVNVNTLRERFGVTSRLPAEGRGREAILAELEAMAALESARWEDGFAFHAGSPGRVRIDGFVRSSSFNFSFGPLASTGAFMSVFPPSLPTLDIIEAAGTQIPLGTQNPVTIALPVNSDTNSAGRPASASPVEKSFADTGTYWTLRPEAREISSAASANVSRRGPVTS